MRWILVIALLTAVACDDSNVKGAEDDPFEDYEAKADSFFAPTEHGILIFGVPLDAELTDDELFHSWDFTLTEDSMVTLSTIPITTNLDTVMYLYLRDSETGQFGSYIEKNDDHGDSMASQISGELVAGEYRIVVKGHKSNIRGRFQVVAECDGEGCGGAAGDCDPETTGIYPDTYADSCGEAIFDVTSGNSQGRSETSVSMESQCDLPEPARIALHAYYAYWDGFIGWEDMFGGYDDEIVVDIDWTIYSNGATFVGVDGGGDEAAMDYIIDADGQVVASYLHNQSPEFEVFCSDGQLYPDPDCGYLYLNARLEERLEEDSGVVERVTEENAGELFPVTALAYRTYLSDLSLQGDVPVTLRYETWNIDAFGDSKVGVVTLEADGQDPITYELGIDYETEYVFTVQRGDAARAFSCEWD